MIQHISQSIVVQICLSAHSVDVYCCFRLFLDKFSFRLTNFFLTDIKSNLKFSHSLMKVSLFSFWLAKKWLDRTFILLWPYRLNSLEIVFVRMLSKSNIEKASKAYGNIAFVYLSVMPWIVSSACLSTFKLHICNLFFRSNGFCASRICYILILFFQCLVFF